MKLFITGSESFVGKELISQCKRSGIDIVGIDLVSARSPEYEFTKMDINSPQVSDVIPANVDAVIHLAALSRDSDCKNNAYSCFRANVMGTLNIIEATKLKNAKQFVFASSEWVYDNFPGGVIKDEEAIIDITKLTSEYALSKFVSEQNLRQQYDNGFCPTTILRFGIIYGPRRNNWSAVESLMSAVKNKNEVEVGSLRSGRRFIHVTDICMAICQSVGLAGLNVLNLTADSVITLGAIIEKSKTLLEKSPLVKEMKPNDINIRNPSNEKAKKLLQWEPKIGINEGLRTLLPFV